MATGKVRRTKTRPGPGQEEQAHANRPGTSAWRPPTRKRRFRRPDQAASVQRRRPR